MDVHAPLSRRELLSRVGTGIGSLGLAAVMDKAGWLDSGTVHASEARLVNSLVPKAPHFAPRAKRVIHLLMNGGVSHVDTFDHKPLLEKYHGQRPAAVDIKTLRKTEGLMKSPFQFQRHGQSGRWVSELFPHLAQCIDDLCIIHSMHTDLPEHVAGLLMMNTGAIQPNRPSLGAWLGYGLGTENQNLPSFISMCHKGRHRPGEPGWNSSFLPGIYSGTFVDTGNLGPGEGRPRPAQPLPVPRRSAAAGRPAGPHEPIEPGADGAGPGPGGQDSVLRAGLSNADGRPRGLRPRPGRLKPPAISTGSRTNRPTAPLAAAPSEASPRDACWLAGFLNGGSGWCSWPLPPTSPGTTMATSCGIDPRPRIATRPLRRCSRT